MADNITKISSEYDMVSIMQDIGKSYFGSDLSTQRVGMFGFLTESMAHMFGAAVLDSSIRSKEYNTATAQRMETLLYEAAALKLEVSNAIPTTMTAYIGIKTSNIINQPMQGGYGTKISDSNADSEHPTYVVVIEKDTVVNIANYDFMFEYDIQVKAIWSQTNSKYMYAVTYLTEGDIDVTSLTGEYKYPKANTLTKLNNVYVPSYITTKDNEGILYFKVDLKQMSKVEDYYTVIKNDMISLTGIEFLYNNMLSHFNIYYRPNNREEWQYVKAVSVYDTAEYDETVVRYEIIHDESKIKININDFTPDYNSEFRIDMYTTLGETTNGLVYSGDGSDIVITLTSLDERHSYAGLELACVPIITLNDGKDVPNMEEVRQRVINMKASLNSIDSEYDLYNFMKSNDGINDYVFIKKRSDAKERRYATFTIPRMESKDIIPSSTLNLCIPLDKDLYNKDLGTELSSGLVYKEDNTGNLDTVTVQAGIPLITNTSNVISPEITLEELNKLTSDDLVNNQVYVVTDIGDSNNELKSTIKVSGITAKFNNNTLVITVSSPVGTDDSYYDIGDKYRISIDDVLSLSNDNNMITLKITTIKYDSINALIKIEFSDVTGTIVSDTDYNISYIIKSLELESSKKYVKWINRQGWSSIENISSGDLAYDKIKAAISEYYSYEDVPEFYKNYTLIPLDRRENINLSGTITPKYGTIADISNAESTSKIFALPYTIVYDTKEEMTSFYLSSVSENISMNMCNDTNDTIVNFAVDHINIYRNAARGDKSYKITVSLMPSGDYSNSYDKENNVYNEGKKKNSIMLKGFIYDDTIQGSIGSCFNFVYDNYVDGIFTFTADLNIDDSLSTTLRTNLIDGISVLDNKYDVTCITGEIDKKRLVIPKPLSYNGLKVSDLKLGIGIYYIDDTDYEASDISDTGMLCTLGFDGNSYSIKHTMIDSGNILYPDFGVITNDNHIYEYKLVNVYNNSTDLINLYTDMSDYIRSYTEVMDNYVFFKDVPVIQYSKLMDDKISARLISIIKQTKEYLQEINDRITNNFSIDYKFFKTYGPCRYFELAPVVESEADVPISLGNLDVKIEFNVLVRNGLSVSDSDLILKLKNHIKSYIESLNENNNDYTIYISNIITEIESQYIDFVKSMELVSVNGNHYKYRILKYNLPEGIKNDSYNVGTSSDIRDYVPEYINVPLDNITINIIRSKY